ncbi:hypothetical protein [Streptomyces sp. NPDC058457]|uniref:hypothetical protein n=1 Tax=Streptomyces sp. NPDC058457 TaxID=3346507 RepID=UPI00365D8A1B
MRVRQGFCEDPATLQHSLDGAEQVLLVSSNDPHADAVVLQCVGIEAAVAAGARRILCTGHKASAPTALSTRRATMPPPSSSWPARASRGPRCLLDRPG